MGAGGQSAVQVRSVERQELLQSRDQQLHSSPKWMGQGIERNLCKCPDDRCLLGNRLYGSPQLPHSEQN